MKNTGFSVEVQHGLDIVSAYSKDEAYGFYMQKILKEYPETDGWAQHGILVTNELSKYITETQ